MAYDRAAPASTIAAASASPCVLLLPVSHIAETVNNKINVIIVNPALPLMDAMPPAAARTKMKRKKAAAPAAPEAASDSASTVMPMPSAAPSTRMGKTTGKKKATKPVNLCATPMWANATNGACHCIVAIAHGQKWVVGNATPINGNIANKPLSGC